MYNMILIVRSIASIVGYIKVTSLSRLIADGSASVLPTYLDPFLPDVAAIHMSLFPRKSVLFRSAFPDLQCTVSSRNQY